MLEHGRWANGSSSGLCCGAFNVGLDAICLLQRLGSLLLRRARLTDGLYAAYPEYGSRAARAAFPPDGHLFAHMLRESFRGKSVSFQICHRGHSLIVEQNVLAVLLIDAPFHGCAAALVFGLLLLLGSRFWSILGRHAATEDAQQRQRCDSAL